MNAKYTPGPWRLIGSVHPVGDAGDVYCGSVDPDPWRGSVCSIQSADHINGISREEAEANGRLIAAAPELLDALQSMVSQFPEAELRADPDLHASVKRARAAIAKAVMQ